MRIHLSHGAHSSAGVTTYQPPPFWCDGNRLLVAVEKAVKGMLPHNKLGRQVIKKLKVYSGPSHPHAAQQPQPYEISQVAQ